MVKSLPARGILLVILIAAIAVIDAAAQRDVPVPPPPALPPADSATEPLSPAAAEEPIEPEITITGKGTEIHEEYRYNGVLYMVKVIPSRGPPYYLIYDERGRSRRSDLEPDIIVPQWVIKRF